MTARFLQHRKGISLIHVVLSLAVVGGGSYAAWEFLGKEESKSHNLLTVEVSRARFVHEIVATGTLQSANRQEIKCEVETGREGVTILELPFGEGAVVKKGDIIAILDSSELDKEIAEQKIQVNTAESTHIQSQNLHETAVIALAEYQDGTFRQERELIESEIFVAEENLKRAEEYHEYSKKLNGLGYVTEVQLQADKFAVDKAQKELDTAKTKLSVLENYTKAKMVMTLKSDINSAEAKMKADKESLDLERKKLKDLETQKEKCEIKSPADGELVYANEHDRRGNAENVIEELGTCWENQTLFWLPDKTQMQVRVKVNESRIGYIKKEMKCQINIDARWGEVLFGEVVRVDTYPVPQHWSASNVREYYVYVDIHNAPNDLRPGLSSEVRIQVKALKDALQIPMQAVREHGEKTYCAVQNAAGNFELREITVSNTNDLNVVVTSGLEPGEIIAHNQKKAISPDDLPAIVETDIASNSDTDAAANDSQPSEEVVADASDRRSSGSSTPASGESTADRAAQ